MRAGQQDQCAGDDDIHERAGDGDEEFLAGLFGNALELRDAADRQQRHKGRRHAEIARGEDVAELVQQHARNSSTMKVRLSKAGRGAARGVAGEEDPGQKQQERDVHPDDGAATLPIFKDQDMKASYGRDRR